MGNALIDLYAKCGTIEDKYKVFDKIPRWNVVSWNAMIMGHAIHGHGKEALNLFEQMQLSETVLDCVIYVGVLSSCVHASLVDDGWNYYDQMSRLYHVTPLREHY